MGCRTYALSKRDENLRLGQSEKSGRTTKKFAMHRPQKQSSGRRERIIINYLYIIKTIWTMAMKVKAVEKLLKFTKDEKE